MALNTDPDKLEIPISEKTLRKELRRRAPRGSAGRNRGESGSAPGELGTQREPRRALGPTSTQR